MSKVYVPQIPHRAIRDAGGNIIRDSNGDAIREPTIDITIASAYGEILEPVFPPLGVPPMTDSNVVRAKHAMKDYDPDVDSIVAIGDPCAIALLATAAALDHRAYSILRWDGRARQYVKLSFKF
jgi:hypothetical protein